MFSTPSLRITVNDENRENVLARKNVQDSTRKPLLDMTSKVELGTPMKLKEKTAHNSDRNEKDDLLIGFSLFKDVPDTFVDLSPMKETDFAKIRDCYIGFRPETPPFENDDFKFEPEPIFVSLPSTPDRSFEANDIPFEEIDEVPMISPDLLVF